MNLSIHLRARWIRPMSNISTWGTQMQRVLRGFSGDFQEFKTPGTVQTEPSNHFSCKPKWLRQIANKMSLHSFSGSHRPCCQHLLPALCHLSAGTPQQQTSSVVDLQLKYLLLSLLSGLFLIQHGFYPSVLPSPPQHALMKCHANTVEGQAWGRNRWPTVLWAGTAPAEKGMCTNTFVYTETPTVDETQSPANPVSCPRIMPISFLIYILRNARHIPWSLS